MKARRNSGGHPWEEKNPVGGEILIINPRGKKMARHRRRDAKGRYLKLNPTRRARPRRHHRRNPGLGSLAALGAANPHRRHHRRRYIHNPALDVMTPLWVLLGAAGSDAALNALGSFVPQIKAQPLKAGAKIGLGFLVEMLGGRFLGRSLARNIGLGCQVSGGLDLYRSYIVPLAPTALGDYQELYGLGLGAVGARPLPALMPPRNTQLARVSGRTTEAFRSYLGGGS